MKKTHTTRSAFTNPRVILSFVFCSIGVFLTLIAFAVYPGASALAQPPQQDQPAGQASSLTSEEAQRLAQGLKPLVNRSSEGLVQVQRADGSVSMDLEGRFQNVVLAKREANGTISQSCVDNPEAAAAFLQIDPQLFGARPTERISKTLAATGQLADRQE